MDSGVFRAGGTAVDPVVGLNTVPDDAAVAVMTSGRERVNGAFKAVEKVRVAPVSDDLNRFVVVVSAYFTFHTLCIAAPLPEGWRVVPPTPLILTAPWR